MLQLFSNIDRSSNFVLEDNLECRYVQRSDDYFIIYVSSHTGCNQACRFCHLTQTKQTQMRDVSAYEYLSQVNQVLNHWKLNHSHNKHLLKKVHVNFMSRGEPLLNRELCQKFKEISSFMASLIESATGVKDIKFKVSTIFPNKTTDHLGRYSSILNSQAEIYYSLYSLDHEFRKRWLPNAMDPIQAAKFFNKMSVTIHYALIKDNNDSVKDAENVIEYVRKHLKHQKPKFNLVRYNPFSVSQGQEATDESIERYMEILERSEAFSRVKEIPRVGQDVHASCGMFYQA